jgi:hypothetical protein
MFSQNGNQPILTDFRGCFPHARDYLKVRLKMLPNFLLLVEVFDMNNISLIKVKLSFIYSCRIKISPIVASP